MDALLLVVLAPLLLVTMLGALDALWAWTRGRDARRRNPRRPTR